MLTIINTDEFDFTLDYNDVKLLVYGVGNEISFIPCDIFFIFPLMEEFMITGPNQELKELKAEYFEDAANLLLIRIENTAIAHLPANLFVYAPSLQNINLQNNLIEIVDHQAFSGLEDLQELSLSGNRISNLQFEVFHGLSNLKILNLNDNICIKKNFYIESGDFSEVENDIKSCAHPAMHTNSRTTKSNTTNAQNNNNTFYTVIETIDEVTIVKKQGTTEHDVLAIFITISIVILILIPSFIIIISLIKNRDPIPQDPRPSIAPRPSIMEDILLNEIDDPLNFY